MTLMNPALCTLLLTATSKLALAAQENEPPARFFHDWHMHSHGFWWIFPLMMFLFFILILPRRHRGDWFGPWYQRHSSSPFSDDSQDNPESNTTSALAILNERYARGEIDKEEYEEKKSTIGPGD